MTSHPALVLAGLVIVGVVLACVACWALAALKLAAGLPLVPWNERRPVPWGLLALLIGLSLPALGFFGDSSPPEKLTLDQREGMVAFGSAVSLGIVVMTAAVVVLLNGATAADLGLSLRSLAGDLRLGVVGFVMLAPPVYLIQGLLVYFWKPSEHPLIKMFQDSPDAGFFALLFIAAAIVAPLFEEFAFRVLLQGFLEKLAGSRVGALDCLVGTVASRSMEQPAGTGLPRTPTLTEPSVDLNPYASPVAAELMAQPSAATPSSQEMPTLRGLRAWLPIAISSTIFALLHWDHGPDWVPLLLLAAGMGYLYQRTHRIVPGLIVHVLLNSASMGGLWIQTYLLPEAGK